MSPCIVTLCRLGQRGSLAASAFEHGCISLTSKILKASTLSRIYRNQDVSSVSPTCSAARGFSSTVSTSLRSSPVRRHQIRCLSTTSKHASRSNSDNASSRSDEPPESFSKKALARSILITGGTSGIGFAIAKQAILEGASHIRIITRDAQRGQAATDKLRKDTSTSIELDYVVAEAEDYADPKLFQTTTHPITTIIHSAGITQTSHLTSIRPEGIRQILTVNLESAALLSKAHLKRYMQTCIHTSRQQNLSSPDNGHQSWQIINISSLLALKGGVGTSIYAASKAGLIALTRATALEGAEVMKRYADTTAVPGFRANVVVPGYIETPMTKGISGSSRGKLLSSIPSGRFGAPGEVADAVMFLLRNEYANNCVLNLDGGLSAT